MPINVNEVELFGRRRPFAKRALPHLPKRALSFHIFFFFISGALSHSAVSTTGWPVDRRHGTRLHLTFVVVVVLYLDVFHSCFHLTTPKTLALISFK